MDIEIVDRGLVYAGDPESRNRSCAFASVAVTDFGRWVCAFRAAPRKKPMQDQHVLVCWSDDRGKTWSTPLEPFAPCSIDGKPGLVRACKLTALGRDRLLGALSWVDYSAPEAPFFNEETEGLLDTRILLTQSEDGGQSWSAPCLMDTSPFNVPTPLTGPLLHLANGQLACQFELNKHYTDPKPWIHKSVLMFSADGGETWPEHSIASHDPENRFFYWDQRPGVLPDGRILDVFWTFDRERAVYLNIHGRESHDHGRTWSNLWDLGIPGQPASPVALPDGSLALVYVDRTHTPTIKCRTTSDGGRSWPESSEIIIHGADVSQTMAKTSMQDAWTEMSKFSIGLPTTAPITPDEFLVVYYEGPETDTTAIRWARCTAV